MADSMFPRSFLDRARSAFGFGGQAAPPAQPTALDPRAASPERAGEPPKPGVYSRAYGGFSIDPAWLSQLALNSDTILQREGAHDLKLYEAVLDDDVAASDFQQRRLAIISRPWEVEAGDESPLAKEAAEHLRGQLNAIGWDRICDLMLYGRWYGFAVAEAMFGMGADGKIKLDDIIVPDRKWFAFTNAGELRLKTAENPNGEALPANKFWAFRTGASHDFTPYGVGLAHWCYWPVWFKKNGIKFWAVYLEKFGMPTALGKFPEGATQEIIDNTLAAAAACGRDAAVAIPNNVELTLMAEGRSSGATYEQFVDEMNDALHRVILSQTGTAKSEAQGLGGSQSEVHKDVRDEVVRSDSDMLHEGFNRTVAKWLTEWNFGPYVAPPRVYRNLDDQEDITAIVERDVKLKQLGWIRTEQSAREVYGDGYERAPEPALESVIPGQKPNAGTAKPADVIDLEEERAKRKRDAAEFAATGPRPLYISRALQPASGKKLLAWAAGKGIPNLLATQDLHATILYSKAPVDWFKMGEDWGSSRELRVTEGGPRTIERFGSSIVLRFASPDLQYRNERLMELGASSDHDEYRPHVTLGDDPDGAFDVEGLDEAFQGEMIFGPEIFESIQEDWMERLENAAFSASDLDQIERFAAALADESEPLLAEFAATLQGKLAGVRDVDGLRLALLDGLERFPAERLALLTGLPFVATRAAAEADAERSIRMS